MKGLGIEEIPHHVNRQAEKWYAALLDGTRLKLPEKPRKMLMIADVFTGDEAPAPALALEDGSIDDPMSEAGDSISQHDSDHKVLVAGDGASTPVGDGSFTPIELERHRPGSGPEFWGVGGAFAISYHVFASGVHAVQASCDYHRKNNRMGCKKRYDVVPGDAVNISRQVLRLKYWCNQAVRCSRQREHIRVLVPSSVPPFAVLLAERPDILPAYPVATDEALDAAAAAADHHVDTDGDDDEKGGTESPPSSELDEKGGTESPPSSELDEKGGTESPPSSELDEKGGTESPPSDFDG